MRKALSIGRVVMVYLLLGFVTTVAVAWGLAWGMEYSGKFSHGSSIYLRGDELHLRIQRSNGQLARREFEPALEFSRQLAMGSDRRLIQYANFGNPNAKQFDRLLRSPFSMVFLEGGSPWWEVDSHSWSALNQEWVWSATFGSDDSWGLYKSLHLDATELEGMRALEDARGLPFLCLWNSWHASPDNTISIRNGIQLSARIPPSAVSQGMKYRALPYMPIWSGLALNTAFYALLFFVFVRLVKGIRHLLRFRRGLCPMCKYDRLFDYRTPCPECGSEGRKRASARSTRVLRRKGVRGDGGWGGGWGMGGGARVLAASLRDSS